MFQIKEQDEALGKDLSETDTGDLLYKEFKIMIVKMLTKLRRTMDQQTENFNRGRKYKYQTGTTDLKNLVIKLKNTIQHLII